MYIHYASFFSIVLYYIFWSTGTYVVKNSEQFLTDLGVFTIYLNTTDKTEKFVFSRVSRDM